VIDLIVSHLSLTDTHFCCDIHLLHNKYHPDRLIVCEEEINKMARDVEQGVPGRRGVKKGDKDLPSAYTGPWGVHVGNSG